jgi:hypothetical protein
VLLMPQPDVRREDSMEQGLDEQGLQRIPLNQEDRGQAEWGFVEFANGKQGAPPAQRRGGGSRRFIVPGATTLLR